MIIDSSAIVAVLIEEPRAADVEWELAGASSCRVGSPTLVETTMVLTRVLGDIGRVLLGNFLNERNFDVLSFSDAHWRVAQTAFVRYGKGRHPAKLNFGDCLTYATARVAGEPLLCIGDDFPRTDLKLVSLGGGRPG